MQFDFQPMQFDFQGMRGSSSIKKSKNLQQIINELDKRSDGSGKHQQEEIDFSNFNPVQQDAKSADKSLTSQLFNRPKQQSIPQSKQHPQFQFQQGSSRDINEISYLNGQQQSFRFQRSMSFEQQNKDNSRFERLKQLMSKAKSNNLDAFYRNLEQTANQRNEGNIIFQNKNQFKQFTRNMRAQKRQQQAKFQLMMQHQKLMMEQKKATQKEKAKSLKNNLFGDQAFKKKQPGQTDFILPAEYSQENDGQEFEAEFFSSGNSPKQQQNGKKNYQDNEYIRQKKEAYAKQAQEFFDFDTNQRQARPHTTNPRSNPSTKRPLQPIRQQKASLLDTSTEQRKFQQLIQNYNSMKGNYKNLMEQLKHTSQSQFHLMEEMQKIRHNFTAQQHLKNSRSNNSLENNKDQMKREEKEQIKREEKQRAKQVKQQQLAQIKNEIHQIKATTSQKDLAYVKINDKIQQLQKLVRVALQQVQQQKIHHSNFVPKVINYYGHNYMTESKGQQIQGSPNKSQRKEEYLNNYQRREEFSDYANLSQQGVEQLQHNYDEEEKGSNNNNQLQSHHQKFASTGGIKRQNTHARSGAHTNKPSSKHQSKHFSNIHSHQTSIRRQFYQHPHSYMQRNPQKQPMNFIDQFSSPLQLDLSMGLDQNTPHSQSEQSYQLAFTPTDGALEYLPLQLDQTQTKNLRSILTQKSSILYQSFEFLVTVKYTIQQDDTYPVIGNLRVANKCAIDLLDVFVIVYGPQGQNVEVSPNKIFQQRLKYNTNIFFEVRLDKMCIKDNGFNMQICYKTDSITKKKINFKALLPIIQLIRPEFCYEENFLDSWDVFRNEIYVRPKKLNFKHIRNHEDLKLVLPFIHISQPDPNTFSYGLMFRYPKSQAIFMLKIACYINGRASVHLRADRNGDQPLKEQLLNVINFLFLK